VSIFLFFGVFLRFNTLAETKTRSVMYSQILTQRTHYTQCLPDSQKLSIKDDSYMEYLVYFKVNLMVTMRLGAFAFPETEPFINASMEVDTLL